MACAVIVVHSVPHIFTVLELCHHGYQLRQGQRHRFSGGPFPVRGGKSKQAGKASDATRHIDVSHGSAEVHVLTTPPLQPLSSGHGPQWTRVGRRALEAMNQCRSSQDNTHIENRCPRSHSLPPSTSQILALPHPSLDGSVFLYGTARAHPRPSADRRHGTSKNAMKPMKHPEPLGERAYTNPKQHHSFSPKPSQLHERK